MQSDMSSEYIIGVGAVSAPGCGVFPASGVLDVKSSSPPNRFHVVGIGASAGGLQAIERFIQEVPLGSGMAYVVVQHLDPVAEDYLPQVLQRVTTMPVVQARDRMRIEPDCVYVIPPGKDMALRGGALRLSALAASRVRTLPIDHFLVSLAEDLGDRAIGVILSGMGSDGRQGMQAIRARNGLCLAQAPTDARSDSMPRSVIEAGLADLVGCAEDLPWLIRGQVQDAPEDAAAPVEPSPKALGIIFRLLRGRTGQEFALYKPSTMLNRIQRRMGLHKIAQLDGYAAFLERNPAELDLLFRELLIGVTRFFRDPAVWLALGQTALPTLFAGRPEGRTFRAWVPACSTGEEAYSLAITFLEALRQVQPPLSCQLQIFATDLDPDAIARARRGLYPSGIAADMSEERLAAYFTHESEGYRIRKEIREMVVFAGHNLLSDPPFIHLDLLSCRNLLIYLKPQIQKDLVALFHASLEPGGLLVLGNSESTGGPTGRFEVLDSRCRLFRRTDAHLPPGMAIPAAFSRLRREMLQLPPLETPTFSLAAQAHAVLWRQFGPPAVVVNEAGDVLYLTGPTSRYLDPPAGQANWNLFAMAREGLLPDLAAALQRAAARGQPEVRRNLRVGGEGGVRAVTFTTQKLPGPGPLDGLFLIVFGDQEGPWPDGGQDPAAQAPGFPPGEQAPETLVQQLHELRAQFDTSQEQLLATQKELMAANEQLQTMNEELQSANEEMMVSQDELRLTNEELRSSREGLQVMYDELQGMHLQGQARLDTLERANRNLANLLDHAFVAVVFLDPALRVVRYTDGAGRLFNLQPGDPGRPLTDLAAAHFYQDLAQDAEAVLRTLASVEKVLPTGDGRWLQVQLRPHQGASHRIEGLVLSGIDITAVKRLEQQIQAGAGPSPPPGQLPAGSSMDSWHLAGDSGAAD